MAPHKLTARLCRTRDGQPLASVDGMPGSIGTDLTPAQLRALAAALLRVADDAEARPLVHRGRPLPDVRREYPLTTG